MTTKKSNLAEAFNKSTEKSTTEVESRPKVNEQTSRQNKKSLNAFVQPEVAKQMKLLSVELEKTQQDLFLEAINELFIKYGKQPIA